jgi:hypothetical protein
MSRSSQPDNPGSAVSTDLVEYLIVCVPNIDALSGVADALARLVDDGTVRILDIVVVQRDPDASLRIVDIQSIAELAQLGGTAGGLLGVHDIELAALAVQPNSVGLIVVTEDRWAQPLSKAAQGAGGRIVAGDRIPARRVEAMLAGQPDEGGTGGRP